MTTNSETVDLVEVKLRGGLASNATAAVCVDLDPGNAGYEWSALVRRDRVQELLGATRATLIGEPSTWDGRPFGDGNGGTVWRGSDGETRGSGLYAPALLSPAEVALEQTLLAAVEAAAKAGALAREQGYEMIAAACAGSAGAMRGQRDRLRAGQAS